MVGLVYTPTATGVTLTAPPNGNIAPPGYYMLFVVDTTGVPSVAAFVKVGMRGRDAEVVGALMADHVDVPRGARAGGRSRRW